MAAEGVLFERAYTPVPLTLPSHATILTGLSPPEHGLRINAVKSLDADIPTLAEHFDQHGYRTSAFIASYVLNSRFGLNRGFGYYNDDVTNGEKGRTWRSPAQKRAADRKCLVGLVKLGSNQQRSVLLLGSHCRSPHALSEASQRTGQRLRGKCL